MELLKMNKKDFIKDMALIVVGNFLIALSACYFVLPFKLLAGGVAGISVIVNKFFGINETITIYFIEISLFVIGTILIGQKFAFSTVVSTIIYPLMISFLNFFPYKLDIDPVLASFYSGVLIGSGTGLVFRTGGSTGGMDIPALLIGKYFKVELSVAALIVDGITVIFGFLAYGMEAVLIGLISVFIGSVMIDRMLVIGGEQAKMVYIISNKYDDISSMIQSDMNRGVTLLNGMGGYLKKETYIIYTVITQREYGQLSRIVRNTDPNAFLVVSDATEVSGEGFTFTKDD